MRRGLSPEVVLETWEGARSLEPIDRALHLRAAVDPATPFDRLANEPIGRRDAALLEGRIATFGARAECFVDCPACDESLEFDLDLESVVAEQTSDAEGPHRLEDDDWSVTFRLPGSLDLVAVSGERNPAGALLERCVMTAERVDLAADDALGVIGDRIDAEMARLDPVADVRIELSCAACGHRWESRFDIATYWWRELEVEARRVLAEVDALARSYGWSQNEILALGHLRRQSYLELIGSR